MTPLECHRTKTGSPAQMTTPYKSATEQRRALRLEREAREAMTWRERTEYFGYRIVFLPGHSLDAKVIAGVRLLPPRPASDVHGVPGFPQRTQIEICRMTERGQIYAHPWTPIDDETGEVFAVVTEAIARAHQTDDAATPSQGTTAEQWDGV